MIFSKKKLINSRRFFEQVGIMGGNVPFNILTAKPFKDYNHK